MLNYKMLGKNCICYYFIPTIHPSKYALSRSGLSVGVEKEGIKEKPLLKHTYTKQDTYDCERKKGSGLSCAQAPYSFSLTFAVVHVVSPFFSLMPFSWCQSPYQACCIKIRTKEGTKLAEGKGKCKEANKENVKKKPKKPADIDGTSKQNSAWYCLPRAHPGIISEHLACC